MSLMTLIETARLLAQAGASMSDIQRQLDCHAETARAAWVWALRQRARQERHASSEEAAP